MRHIALLLILLAGCFCSADEQRTCSVPCHRLIGGQTAAELIAEVRDHTFLNLPTTLESLPSSARLSARTTAKSFGSRHGQHGVAQVEHSHRTIAKSYGGAFAPQTVATQTPHRVLVRLCRWII